MWIQPLIFKGTLSRDYLLITNERTETFQFSKYAELDFDFLNLVIETAFGDAQRAVAAAALKSVSNGNNLTALKQLKGKMRLTRSKDSFPNRSTNQFIIKLYF